MKNIEHIKKVTPYHDVNDVLCFLAQSIQNIFGNQLVGIYLTGSLTYGDFDMGRSDVDLAVVLKNPASGEKIEQIKKLHQDTEQKFEKWSKRIECSYIPLEMLKSILPPEKPRPYFGGGIFYPEAPYGNEWIINQYFLYKCGIALIGPDFKTLVEPINTKDVQEASIRDLYKEWEPKITDAAYLEDSHQQSYVVLNLCRILYTVMQNDAVSKKVATSWAKQEYPEWKDLIEAADNWHYGIKMERQKEVIEFIKFVVDKVKEKSPAKSILIAGVSGVGKSSVCIELAKRGRKACDIEDVEGLFAMIDRRTGKPFVSYDNYDFEKVRHLDWICDKNKLQIIMQKNRNGLVYYCGTATNNDEILPLFDKIILLQVNPELIRKRLSSRTNNDFGRTSEVQDWVLSWKDSYEKGMIEKGAIVIDSNRSLAEVADEIIKKIEKSS